MLTIGISLFLGAANDIFSSEEEHNISPSSPQCIFLMPIYISAPDSTVKVYVIPTDEEVMIARDAYNLCK